MGSILRMVQVGVLVSPYHPALPSIAVAYHHGSLEGERPPLTATLVMPESSRMPHHGRGVVCRNLRCTHRSRTGNRG